MAANSVQAQQLPQDESHTTGAEKDLSLAKIKRQLAPPAGSVPMQGYLLKRSETLRKWNQRWFTLDPSTAKMEYRVQRGDPFPRGLLVFEAGSTITVSPLNFHGAKQYEGCCFYIGGASRKEYFLCAETPGAARAWVATLRAAALVLKAHREAVASIGVSNGGIRSNSGAVAAAAAMANATAREAAKEVAVANQRSVLGQHHLSFDSAEPAMDNVSIMKETLRVKDEELRQMAVDLRMREATINELANRLSETAQAAESAAESAQAIDKQRIAARAEVDKVRKDMEDKLEKAANHVKAAQEREAQALAMRNEVLLEFERVQEKLKLAINQITELQAVAAKAELRSRECETRERQAEAAKEAAFQDACRWQLIATRLAGGNQESIRQEGKYGNGDSSTLGTLQGVSGIESGPRTSVGPAIQSSALETLSLLSSQSGQGLAHSNVPLEQLIDFGSVSASPLSQPNTSESSPAAIHADLVKLSPSFSALEALVATDKALGESLSHGVPQGAPQGPPARDLLSGEETGAAVGTNVHIETEPHAISSNLLVEQGTQPSSGAAGQG